jgi:threonine dehydrogenase-like Zn-dependent dehydrogenase
VCVVARSESKTWAMEREAGSCFVRADAPELSAEYGRHSLVIDATGAAQGLVTAVTLAGLSGRVVLIGSPRSPVGDVPLEQVHDRGIHVVGAHVRALDALARQSGVDLRARFTESFFAALEAGVSLADVIALRPPEMAAGVYRELSERASIVGLGFDWTQP